MISDVHAIWTYVHPSKTCFRKYPAHKNAEHFSHHVHVQSFMEMDNFLSLLSLSLTSRCSCEACRDGRPVRLDQCQGGFVHARIRVLLLIGLLVTIHVLPGLGAVLLPCDRLGRAKAGERCTLMPTLRLPIKTHSSLFSHPPRLPLRNS